MTKPIVIWISVVLWILSIIVVFVTQGNDVANGAVLVLSVWLMYLGWTLNKKGRSKMWIKLPKVFRLGKPPCDGEVHLEINRVEK